MKVWQITHDIMGEGYISEEVDCFKTDLEEELACDASYKKEDIDPFLEKLKILEPGQSLELYPWKITCKKMKKEELDGLEEFPGW
jgi:hypothetical protein